MTKQIVKKESSDLSYAGFNSEEIQLIKEALVPAGTTDAEFKAFLMMCNKKRLDPFQRQIYLIPRWDSKLGKNKMTPQTSIDGFRAIAARTGAYAGNDAAVFDNRIAPKTASVTVYRIVQGMKCSFTAEVEWAEFFPGEKLGFMWKTKPKLMLGKVAEAQALRKAFPEDLADLYIDEEMQKRDTNSDEIFIPAGTTHILSPEGMTPITNQVDEETKEARAYLRERLIGKFGLFPNDFKGARAFIMEAVKKTFEELTADDCQEIIARIDANIEPEPLAPLSEEDKQQEIFK